MHEKMSDTNYQTEPPSRMVTYVELPSLSMDLSLGTDFLSREKKEYLGAVLAMFLKAVFNTHTGLDEFQSIPLHVAIQHGDYLTEVVVTGYAGFTGDPELSPTTREMSDILETYFSFWGTQELEDYIGTPGFGFEGTRIDTILINGEILTQIEDGKDSRFHVPIIYNSDDTENYSGNDKGVIKPNGIMVGVLISIITMLALALIIMLGGVVYMMITSNDRSVNVGGNGQRGNAYENKTDTNQYHQQGYKHQDGRIITEVVPQREKFAIETIMRKEEDSVVSCLSLFTSDDLSKRLSKLETGTAHTTPDTCAESPVLDKSVDHAIKDYYKIPDIALDYSYSSNIESPNTCTRTPGYSAIANDSPDKASYFTAATSIPSEESRERKVLFSNEAEYPQDEVADASTPVEQCTSPSDTVYTPTLHSNNFCYTTLCGVEAATETGIGENNNDTDIDHSKPESNCHLVDTTSLPRVQQDNASLTTKKNNSDEIENEDNRKNNFGTTSTLPAATENNTQVEDQYKTDPVTTQQLSRELNYHNDSDEYVLTSVDEINIFSSNNIIPEKTVYKSHCQQQEINDRENRNYQQLQNLQCGVTTGDKYQEEARIIINRAAAAVLDMVEKGISNEQLHQYTTNALSTSSAKQYEQIPTSASSGMEQYDSAECHEKVVENKCTYISTNSSEAAADSSPMNESVATFQSEKLKCYGVADKDTEIQHHRKEEVQNINENYGRDHANLYSSGNIADEPKKKDIQNEIHPIDQSNTDELRCHPEQQTIVTDYVEAAYDIMCCPGGLPSNNKESGEKVDLGGDNDGENNSSSLPTVQQLPLPLFQPCNSTKLVDTKREQHNYSYSYCKDQLLFPDEDDDKEINVQEKDANRTLSDSDDNANKESLEQPLINI